jgi:dTMP kinase
MVGPFIDFWALVPRGRFITLEGGEGVGKSTQVKALASALAERGISVIATREPGGTQGGEAIRALLMTGDEDRWNARTEALLFAAARADHVAKLILPALERGDWVICDRFIDSTRAYQGGAGGVSDAEIMALHQIGSKGLLPDRTLLLDMLLTTAQRRAVERDDGLLDRMGAKPDDYYDRVVSQFKVLASQEPDRFRMILANQEIDAVTRALLGALSDYL